MQCTEVLLVIIIEMCIFLYIISTVAYFLFFPLSVASLLVASLLAVGCFSLLVASLLVACFCFSRLWLFSLEVVVALSVASFLVKGIVDGSLSLSLASLSLRCFCLASLSLGWLL
jgi:hypothetical protein